ncbi:cytochrome P450, partial [Auriscalpium vulgare]
GNKIIFGEGLISTLGEQHKKQRKMLNPVFSLANMRVLLPIIQPIADKLRDLLTSQVQESGQSKEIDVLPWMTRGTLEYISQAGLGYSFNALQATKTHPYTEALKSLAPTALGIIMLRPLIPVAIRNFSLHWRNKLIDWLPIKGLKKMREIVRVMDRSSRQIFQEKKDALDKNAADAGETPVEGDVGARLLGKDIMSILLNANTASDDADRLTEAEILGQMNTIIFAGFETTTTAICRILYIIASSSEVQARLRSELKKARLAYKAAQGLPEEQRWEDVQLSYDALMALPYLDAVVRETLRVHPPTSLLSRVARQSTTLPLQYPVRAASGAHASSVAVPEGTTVIISILAANHNKDVWGEDASVWKPERWLTASGERIRFSHELDGALGENQEFEGEGTPGSKTGVKYPGVYASMMTFLGGGRACIGFKFAEMEIKQVVTALISTLHFSLPSDDKEIYWKINGLQVPVVRPPSGDGVTPAVPLDVRLVRESDF